MNNVTSLEIRKVVNGFVVSVVDAEGESLEYIFDSDRKLFKFLRMHLLTKGEE